jgi:hypothetical protein
VPGKAENTAKEIMSLIHLIVCFPGIWEGATVTSNVKSNEAKIGTDIVLRCEVNGSTGLDYKWYR